MLNCMVVNCQASSEGNEDANAGSLAGWNVVMERLKVSLFSAKGTSSGLINFADYTMV